MKNLIYFLLFSMLLSSVLVGAINSTTEENVTSQIIGGDKDEHGCLIAAGYSWCEPRDKCLRTFEEICPKTLDDYKNLTLQQERYIKELNATIDRKDFGISVVNNNIKSCMKQLSLRNKEMLYGGIGLLILAGLIFTIKAVKHYKNKK